MAIVSNININKEYHTVIQADLKNNLLACDDNGHFKEVKGFSRIWRVITRIFSNSFEDCKSIKVARAIVELANKEDINFVQAGKLYHKLADLHTKVRQKDNQKQIYEQMIVLAKIWNEKALANSSEDIETKNKDENDFDDLNDDLNKVIDLPKDFDLNEVIDIQPEDFDDLNKSEVKSLESQNLRLQETIRNTQLLPPDPIRNLTELQTHVHQIFDNVYLGNLRAYYSVDPEFVETYSMVDSEEDMVESFRLYDSNLSKQEAKELYQAYKTATERGCSDLNIKHVISVTQFKAKETVSPDDWSRFQPNLDELKIDRMQIKVDDDEFAWNTINPYLDAIFDRIDQARLNGEPILIHCVEGKSRSATVLIAYLINRCQVSFDEALTFVQSKRPQAEPKPSLAEALRTYLH